MKAAILKKPGNIVIEEIEKPQVSDDQVLIKIKYTGICGSDIHYYEHGRIGDFIVKKPIILGHESSGEIVETGKNVKNVQVGDGVTIEPGYACTVCAYCKKGQYNLCDKMTFMATPPVDWF